MTLVNLTLPEDFRAGTLIEVFTPEGAKVEAAVLNASRVVDLTRVTPGASYVARGWIRGHGRGATPRAQIDYPFVAGPDVDSIADLATPGGRLKVGQLPSEADILTALPSVGSRGEAPAKQSVLVATTANVALSGAQTIDGVGVNAGQRVLVKNQTAPAENGIYVCATGSWARATDADEWTKLVSARVRVDSGTVWAEAMFDCTVAAGGTLGTTSVAWTARDVVVNQGNSRLARLRDNALDFTRNGFNYVRSTAVGSTLAITTPTAAGVETTRLSIAAGDNPTHAFASSVWRFVNATDILAAIRLRWFSSVTTADMLVVESNSGLEMGAIDYRGGVRVGTAVTSDAAIHAQGGGIRAESLGRPGQPTVTNQGSAGSTSYTYWAIAVDRWGNRTLPSLLRTTTTGNATLSGANFNRVTGLCSRSAQYVEVYRATAADITHASLRRLSALVVPSAGSYTYDDTGAAGSVVEMPTYDETGSLTVDGLLHFPGKRWLTPYDFGAVAADYETHARAFQRAFNAAAQVGGGVYAPANPNTWRLSEEIVIEPPMGQGYVKVDFVCDGLVTGIRWTGGDNASVFRTIGLKYSDWVGVGVALMSGSEAGVCVFDFDYDTDGAGSSFNSVRHCLTTTVGTGAEDCIGYRVTHNDTEPTGAEGSFWTFDTCQAIWGGQSSWATSQAANNVGFVINGTNTLAVQGINCTVLGCRASWSLLGDGTNSGNASHRWENCGGSYNQVEFELATAGPYVWSGGRWENGGKFITTPSVPTNCAVQLVLDGVCLARMGGGPSAGQDHSTHVVMNLTCAAQIDIRGMQLWDFSTGATDYKDDWLTVAPAASHFATVSIASSALAVDDTVPVKKSGTGTVQLDIRPTVQKINNGSSAGQVADALYAASTAAL